MAGVPIPHVEIGIALSVIVLGAIVALGIQARAAAAMGIGGFFAIFHGHAHGAEMPQDAAGLSYGIGFMLATALLHAVGIGIGFLVGFAGFAYGKTVYRIAGSLVAIAEADGVFDPGQYRAGPSDLSSRSLAGQEVFDAVKRRIVSCLRLFSCRPRRSSSPRLWQNRSHR